MATRTNDLLALRIEGVGDANGQYYFADQSRDALDDASTADPNSRIIGGVLKKWPSSSAATLRFLPGSRPAFGGQTFELRRTAQLLGIFARRPSVYAEATASLSATGTSLSIDVAGATGKVLWWHREALLLGTESPSKTYDVTSGRGHLGTPQQYHDGVSSRADDELFEHNHALQKRVVELVRIPKDTAALSTIDAADPEWIGVLRNVPAPKDPALLELECDDLLSILVGTRLLPEQWRGTVSGYGRRGNGAQGWEFVTVNVRDGAPDLVSLNQSVDALLMFDEKHAVRVSSIGSSTRPSILRANTEAWGDSPEMLAPTGEVWEIHSTAPNNPLGLSSDPDTLLLQHLYTGSFGTNHASLDLSVEGLGLDLTDREIDEDAIKQWGRRVAGAELALHLGVEGEPLEAEGWIQDKVLGLFGAYLVQSKSGKFKVIMLADAAVYGSSSEILEADCIGLVSQDPMLHESFDKVELHFNNVPGLGPVRVEGDSSKKYQRNPRGEHGDVTIHADGIVDSAEAQMWAGAHVERWHDGIPTVRLRTNADKDFDLGDVVSLTHSKVFSYDEDATFGITAEACLVAGRKPTLDNDGRIFEYTLLRVGAIYAVDGYIAPSAEVVSYDAGTNELVLDANIFSDDSNDPINPDYEGFAISSLEKIQICNEEGTVLTGASAVKIDSRSGDTLTLNSAYAPSAPNYPSAGDIVRVTAHNTANATQKATWDFKADADNELSSSAAPKVYKLI